MLIVIALGGNALLQRGQPLEAHLQLENIKVTAKAIAKLAAKHQIVICHGNGPQVGLLVLQNEAYTKVSPYPLDVLDAESQGMIGYLIQQEVRNELSNKSVTTLLTQIVVDANDPAFKDPSKPIGPVYDKTEADEMIKTRGWQMAADNQYYRRVVPSPQPKEIVELRDVHALLELGSIVICGGGGGIPVVRKKDGRLEGVEAVIDKDNTASLIAEKLGADALMILTDVESVYTNWGKPSQKAIKAISPTHLNDMDFARGSMGPKIKASSRFALKTGKFAAIGKLDDAADILSHKAGTRIGADVTEIEYY